MTKPTCLGSACWICWGVSGVGGWGSEFLFSCFDADFDG